MRELDIALELTKLEIVYKRETSIGQLDKHFNRSADDYSKQLRFDYYLPTLNLVIEFDGEQHFNIVDYFGGLGTFLHNHNNDVLKINFCKEHGIRMLRLHHQSSIEDLHIGIQTFVENDDFAMIAFKNHTPMIDLSRKIADDDFVTHFARIIEERDSIIEEQAQRLTDYEDYFAQMGDYDEF